MTPGWSARFGYALVLVGVLGFSVNAGVSRLVLDAGVDAWTLSELRAAGAALLLLVLLAVTGRLRRAGVPRSQWWLLAVYGVVGIGLLQSFYFEAIARIPIGLALLIEYLAPVWVALWARFVAGQAVSAVIWPALGLTLCGLGIVAGAGVSGLDPIGVAAAFGASVAFAAYFLLGERLVADHDPLVVSFWGFTVAGAGWMLAAFVLPVITPVWDIDVSLQAPLPDGESTVAVGWLLLWVLVLGTVMPFVAETAAMQWVPATAVSVIAMLEPLGAGAIAWWWFDERLSVVQLAGAAMVIAGVILALRSRSAHPVLAPPE